MFAIIYGNDIEVPIKPAFTPEDVYELALDYFYEVAGQELDEAISNATDAQTWAESAIPGDAYCSGNLLIECSAELE